MNKYLPHLSIVLLATLAISWWTFSNQPTTPNPPPEPNSSIDNPITPTTLVEPTPDFKSRITKKPFGIYVTPQNSPVSPEKFSGYHTAIDIEYDDITQPVAVQAIADGEVVVARTATGYGGVIVIRHRIGDQDILILYGHIDPATFPKTKSVTAGQNIGTLGEAYSPASGGERKHLHLGMLKGDQVNLAGYTKTKSALDAGWHDPLTFF